MFAESKIPASWSSRKCPDLRAVAALAATVLASALPGCSTTQSLHRFEYARVSMGVQARVVLYAADDAEAFRAANAAYDRIGQLNAIMSDYMPGSELSRLSDRAGGPAVRVSDDLLCILTDANRISEASDGAFDVSVGPLVRLWRSARKTGRPIDPVEAGAALRLVDWRAIEIKPTESSVRLKLPGMCLDLGGIAKGYAAEEAVVAMRRQHVDRALVALAGDIYVGSAPPGEEGWKIAVSDGRTEPGSRADEILLANAAVSTSGDSEQFLEIGGVRYSHLIDPHTGLGVTASRSVTVIAPHGWMADAISSALCIRGLPGDHSATDPLFVAFPTIAVNVQENTPAGPVSWCIDPTGIMRWLPTQTKR